MKNWPPEGHSKYRERGSGSRYPAVWGTANWPPLTSKSVDWELTLLIWGDFGALLTGRSSINVLTEKNIFTSVVWNRLKPVFVILLRPEKFDWSLSTTFYAIFSENKNLPPKCSDLSARPSTGPRRRFKSFCN